MNTDQKKAYEWAKNQKYSSVAARYAKTLTDVIEELQSASYSWIPVSDRCPEEPEAELDLQEMPEYIVMIRGAVRPTSLIYTGAGEWYDGITEDYYPVVAWCAMPEPYQYDN